jgi:hypothetical protein
MTILAWLRSRRRCRSWYTDDRLGTVRCQSRLDHADYLHRHVRKGGRAAWPDDGYPHDDPPPWI